MACAFSWPAQAQLQRLRVRPEPALGDTGLRDGELSNHWLGRLAREGARIRPLLWEEAAVGVRRRRWAAADALLWDGHGSSVEPLIQAFQATGDLRVAQALGMFATPRAIRFLVDSVASSHGRTAVEGLRWAGAQALPMLLGSWPEGRELERIELLSELRDASALPTLIGALDDADANVRQRALVGLGSLGDARAAAALRRIASDAQSPERTLALGILTQFGFAEDIPLFEGQMAENPALALRGLLRATPERGAELLEEALRDQKEFAEELLLQNASVAVLPLLLQRALEGRSCMPLAQVHDGRGIPALVEAGRRGLCKEALAIAVHRWSDREVAEEGRAWLASLPRSWEHDLLRAMAGDSGIGPSLEAALSSPEAEHRGWAALGLQYLGGSSVLELLGERLLEEQDDEAWRRAAEAWVHLGGRGRRPSAQMRRVLRRRLRSPETAPEALAVLARCQPRGRWAQQAVLRALRSPEPRVRAAAARAMGEGLLGRSPEVFERVLLPRLFRESEEQVLHQMLRALGRAGDGRLLRRWSRLLYERTAHLRWHRIADAPEAPGPWLALVRTEGEGVQELLFPDGVWVRQGPGPAAYIVRSGQVGPTEAASFVDTAQGESSRD